MKIYNLSSENSLSMNSSGGQLLKWKIGDTYIKTSTLDKQSLETKFMYESYAEVISSRIGQKLGLNIVKYKLCEVIIDNSVKTIACESKEFKPDGYKELSIARLILTGKIDRIAIGDRNGYQRLIESVYKIFGINIREYIDTLIIFDSLILNTDRHFGNFGLMINEKGKVETIPIFDNGNSLFCDKYINGLSYDERLIQYLRFRPFCMDYEEQLNLTNNKTKLKVDVLKNYIGGLLYEMVDNGLPKKRANFIKALLDDRINYIEKINRYT